jgi:hypothetical protein
MKKNLMVGAMLLSSALLAACGGSGGDDSSSTPGAAQGAYEGKISTGQVLQALILDDDQYYTLYGQESGGMFMLEGFVQGNGKADNGRFASSNLRDYYFDGTVATGSLSASYTPGVSFDGTVSADSQTVTFTSTAIPGTDFDYNAAANLSNIVGTWSMTSLQGDAIALDIQSSGAFSATSGGCLFSGNIAPQSASGIAIEHVIGTQRELILAGTTTDRANGTAMFGVR